MRRSKPKKSPIEKELDRIEMAKIVLGSLNALLKHSKYSTNVELIALESRIKLCNSLENCYAIDGVTSETSFESYTLVSRFWRCGSKLCPSCLARQSWQTRKRLREALKRQRPRKGQRYYFLTFTIPNPDLSLVETRSIVNRAWSLFRKRSLCVSSVGGGSKSEEFTVTPNGFHYHLHCLWLSKWLLYNEVRRVWTDCVKQAFADHDRPFTCRTVDEMLNVVIKPVTPNDKTIFELCKYVTKCDSWSKIRKSDLAEIALIQRWSRMFEVFGSFREPSEVAESHDPSIVHTRSLSDGGSEPSLRYWRNQVREFGVERYRERLYMEYHAKATNTYYALRLQYPDKRPKLFAEWSQDERWRLEQIDRAF
jgi:hypothetical protein